MHSEFGSANKMAATYTAASHTLTNSQIIAHLRDLLKSHNDTIQNEYAIVEELESSLRDCLELEQLDNTDEVAVNDMSDIEEFDRIPVIPIQLQLRDDDSFDNLVLSFAVNGKIQSTSPLDNLQQSFPPEVADFNVHEYTEQFAPFVLEDLKSTVEEKLKKIESSAERPFVAKVNSGSDARAEKKNKSTGTVYKDMTKISLKCSATKREFPQLEHGLNKELICILLPSHNRSAKRMNCILAIAYPDTGPVGEVDVDGIRRFDCIDHRTKEVFFAVEMLAHDFHLLHDHTYNVYRQTTVTSLKWHWLAGLVRAARMHEACTSQIKLPRYFRDAFSAQWKEWPAAAAIAPTLRPGLNEVQTAVVNSLCTADDPGMFCLVGPPGTGKTTTIVSLLQERVRAFPRQKILLTAPSNKAVQVVVYKLLQSTPAAALPVIALVGTKVPDDLKAYCPAHCATVLCASLRAALFSRAPIGQRRFSLLKTLDDFCALHTANLKAGAKSGSKIVFKIGAKVGEGTGASAGLWAKELGRKAVGDVYNLVAGLKRMSIQAQADTCTDIESFEKVIKRCISAVKRGASALETYLLQRAQIVFSTLVAAGRRYLAKVICKFDTVILDEASQALIPAAIIPFQYSPQLFVQVGDPQQLPATVKSNEARLAGYGDSLMLVLQEENKKHELFPGDISWAQMLTTQYRAHPSICKWTSDRFYDSKLCGAEHLNSRVSPLSALPAAFPLQSLPSAFITLRSTELKQEDGSKSNAVEAELVVEVAAFLLQHKVRPEQIGIIAFYSGQVKVINDLLMAARIKSEGLAVSTVDGFQGDEKDFVLVSCVRTNPSAGFLSDHRRINVALSRARHARWVFGDADKLAGTNTALSDFLGWIADPVRNSCAPATAVVEGSEVLQQVHGIDRRENRWDDNRRGDHQNDRRYPSSSSANVNVSSRATPSTSTFNSDLRGASNKRPYSPTAAPPALAPMLMAAAAVAVVPLSEDLAGTYDRPSKRARFEDITNKSRKRKKKKALVKL